MRVLYFCRYDRSLSFINAVLGAGVVLPDVMATDSNINLFDELDEDRIRQVIDMYFYTVNIFREFVSAYVSQNERLMRKKVLTRLSELIELEQKIKEVLAQAPDDYVPPACVSLTEQSIGRSNVMRFKKTFGKRYLLLLINLYFYYANFKLYLWSFQLLKNQQQNARKHQQKHKRVKPRILLSMKQLQI